ncbi:MAG: hypothetical protein JOY61_16870 [Chloroflexi bacterium]|nr:hypothetical protein [Chloroflexota bacterium]
MKSADDACNARDYTVFLEQPSGYGHVDRPVFTTFFTMLSPTLLTPETSAVLIVDYQHHVMVGINSGDHDVIELNGRALARATRTFNVPVILSTIGVQKPRSSESFTPEVGR